MATPYPNGIETGLALNTNSPRADNNAGIISILISSSVTITTSQSGCPVTDIVLLNTEPSGAIPYSEGASAIIENSPPSAVTYEWN